MGKSKIAFVIPSLVSGGAERVVSTLSNYLISDFIVYIITYSNKEPFYPLDKRIKVLNIAQKEQSSSNLLMAINNNFVRANRLLRIIKSEEINILISFLTSANVVTSLVAKYKGIPCIISERNNPSTVKISIIWKILKDLTYPLADIIVVQTDNIRNYYSTKTNPQKLVRLPNPISPELSSKRNNKILKEKIILNVGRLSDQKAQDVIIHAFANTKNDSWKLIIIGEGSNRKKYTDLIKKLNLTDKIFLLGQSKDIAQYYNKAKIFAFSSIYEGFPNALIEAMYFGLACVTTNCPYGPSELIVNGKNGYIVPVNDVIGLSKYLNILMEDNDQALLVSNQAKKSVLNYEIIKVGQKWKDLITELLKLS